MPPIDQMKLQKLLFYGHGWYLANNDCPLFDDDFEAWPWGPVLRDIYFQTKDFGRKPINNYIPRITVDTSKGKLEARFDTPKLENTEVRDFLKMIWDVHKRYSGIQLSNSTHAAGEPWTIIKERLGVENKPTIPTDVIAEVFKKKLADTRAAATAASSAAGHSAA